MPLRLEEGRQQQPENRPQEGRRQQVLWNVLGKRLPETEVVFISQVILVYIVVITCIANLSLKEENTTLWICLMSSCLGYLLPNPTLNTNQAKRQQPQHGTDVPDSPQQQL